MQHNFQQLCMWYVAWNDLFVNIYNREDLSFRGTLFADLDIQSSGLVMKTKQRNAP